MSKIEKPVRAFKILNISQSNQCVCLQEIPPYSNLLWDIHWTCPFNKVSILKPTLNLFLSLVSSSESQQEADSLTELISIIENLM